ncbi:MAG: hypothetical protein IJZ80_08695 [Clostridia bacterium]|nr:hypothetical protein [Clostridia bacterium]
MKKNALWILAVLTVSVLMFSLIAVAATPAAANSLTITSESKTALAGDTVTVILKVTENPGVAYLRLTLEYDDALTLTNAENGTIIKDFDRGVNLMWSADANSTATGTLVTLTFQIAEDAEVGEYPITVKLRECYNDALSDVSATVSNGSVKVTKCLHVNTVSVAAKAATCKEAGYTAGVWCEDCDTYISGHETVPVTDTHTFGAWTQVLASTCTEKGSERRDCGICDYYETRETDALGHTLGTWVTTSSPTCTEKGSKRIDCEACDHYETQEIAATGHIFGGWVKIQSPTCTENGSERRNCGSCTHYETRPIAATGHTEATDAMVPATCTTTGLSQGKHCTVCGTVTVKQTVIPALGHTELIQSGVPATCTQSGLTEGRTCAVCGTVTIKQTAIPALGHTEAEDAAVMPTCTQSGLTAGAHCSVCGTVLTAQAVVPATGHGAPTDWTVTVEAQPGVAGLKEKLCPTCGEVLESETIEPLPVDTSVDTGDTGDATAEPADGCSGSFRSSGMLIVLVTVSALALFGFRKKKETV